MIWILILTPNIWEVKRDLRRRDRSALGNDEDGNFEIESADIEDVNAILPTRNRCKVVNNILALIRPREAANSQRIT